MKLILLVLIGIQVSVAAANINYSTMEVSDMREALTNAIMTAVINKCDHLETREAYYDCVSNSVNEVLQSPTLPPPPFAATPKPPIPWEQNPPGEPGPDEVPAELVDHLREWPLAKLDMPEGNDEREPGPDDLYGDGLNNVVRKIPLGPSVPIGPDDNEREGFWPLF